MAIGGSTNAVLHLTAIAGRAGVDIDLRRLNEISDATPVIVDLKPTGTALHGGSCSPPAASARSCAS